MFSLQDERIHAIVTIPDGRVLLQRNISATHEGLWQATVCKNKDATDGDKLVIARAMYTLFGKRLSETDHSFNKIMHFSLGRILYDIYHLKLFTITTLKISSMTETIAMSCNNIIKSSKTSNAYSAPTKDILCAIERTGGFEL